MAFTILKSPTKLKPMKKKQKLNEIQTDEDMLYSTFLNRIFIYKFY